MSSERQPLLGVGGGEAMDHSQPPASQATLINVPSSSDSLDTVQSSSADTKEDLFYDPLMNRTVEHPTSNLDTLIHLLKGNIGTGILAMPDAFKNAGLYVGLFGTLLMGVICTHCMHMLVRCSHELSRRLQVPSLDFSQVCSASFETGPRGLRRHAKGVRTVTNVFLCITQLGFCCVYFLFVALNLQEVVTRYYAKYDIRIYLLLLLGPMIVINLVKNLKFLTPISLLASFLTVGGLGITFHYLLQDLPRADTVEGFSSWSKLPLYFGTAIYAFEGIGIVLPLENNMKTPEDLVGTTGVLNTGMAIVACLYTAVGFFGYLKYGDKVSGSITLDLPDTFLAKSVLITMAIAIFFSYSLQFYVPCNIMGPWVKSHFHTEQQKNYAETIFRTVLVIFTFLLASMIPNLGGIISLVGAVSSSTLALIFPPIVEIVTFWPDGLGRHNWIFWKDLLIILFGLLGFVFGTYTSLLHLLYPEING